MDRPWVPGERQIGQEGPRSGRAGILGSLEALRQRAGPDGHWKEPPCRGRAVTALLSELQDLWWFCIKIPMAAVWEWKAGIKTGQAAMVSVGRLHGQDQAHISGYEDRIQGEPALCPCRAGVRVRTGLVQDQPWPSTAVIPTLLSSSCLWPARCQPGELGTRFSMWAQSVFGGLSGLGTYLPTELRGMWTGWAWKPGPGFESLLRAHHCYRLHNASSPGAQGNLGPSTSCTSTCARAGAWEPTEASVAHLGPCLLPLPSPVTRDGEQGLLPAGHLDVSMATTNLENQLHSAQKNLLFLQREHASTLRGLHAEIRRLQQHCTGAGGRASGWAHLSAQHLERPRQEGERDLVA